MVAADLSDARGTRAGAAPRCSGPVMAFRPVGVPPTRLLVGSGRSNRDELLADLQLRII